MYLLLCSFVIYYQEYNLSSPTKTYTLPATLNEISGITILNNNEIACVQDELGIIYIYDLKEGKIIISDIAKLQNLLYWKTPASHLLTGVVLPHTSD